MKCGECESWEVCSADIEKTSGICLETGERTLSCYSCDGEEALIEEIKRLKIHRTMVYPHDCSRCGFNHKNDICRAIMKAGWEGYGIDSGMKKKIRCPIEVFKRQGRLA